MRHALVVVGLIVIAAGAAACGKAGSVTTAVDRHVSVTLYNKRANQDRCDYQVADPVHVTEGDTLLFDVINLCTDAQDVQVVWAGSGSGAGDRPSDDTPSGHVPNDQSIVPLRAAIRRDAADHTSSPAKPKTYHYRFTISGQSGPDPDIVVDYAP